MLLAGAVSGGTAALLVGGNCETFRPPAKLDNLGPGSSPEQYAAQMVAIAEANRKNTTLCMALVGANVCCLLGFGAGVAQRHVAGAMGGLVAGILLGAIFGALGGAGSVYLDQRLHENRDLNATFRTMIAHSAGWVLVGLGAALSTSVASLSSRRVVPAMAAAVFAGIIAAALYCPLATFLFPLAVAESPLPTGAGNRLLWTSLAAVLMAIAIARAQSHGCKRLIG